MIHYDVQQIIGQLSEEKATEYNLKIALIAAIGVLAYEMESQKQETEMLRMAIQEAGQQIAQCVQGEDR